MKGLPSTSGWGAMLDRNANELTCTYPSISSVSLVLSLFSRNYTFLRFRHALSTQPFHNSEKKENKDLFLMSVCLSCRISPSCPGAMVVGREEESSESLLSGNVHRCSTYKVVRLHKTRMEGLTETALPLSLSLFKPSSSSLLSPQVIRAASASGAHL